MTESRPFVTYKVAMHARRPRDGAGVALGDRRGEPAPRARAARERRRGGGRHGHRARRRSSPRRPRGRRRAPAATPRVRPAGRCRKGRELELRTGALAGRVGRARRGRRAVASAGGRADPRHGVSRARDSSTSCSSSSPRRSPATGRRFSASCPQPMRLSRMDVQRVGDDVLRQRLCPRALSDAIVTLLSEWLAFGAGAVRAPHPARGDRQERARR